MTRGKINPAEQASQEALKKVYHAIDESRNFLLEAGAGAGKTYSLIKALKYCIEKKGKSFQKAHQRIACITYTEVARDEIGKKVDNNPVVLVSTIHSFAWSLIRGFQKRLKELVPNLSDNWKKRVEEAGDITAREVVYNLGYPKITDTEILLHHDDVIKLMTEFLKDEKFKSILVNKFPIIFIDEYQDTAKNLAEAIITNFIEQKTGPLIGFFGDHWQKIYGTKAIGEIRVSADRLLVIDKNANFRSEKNIVAALNRMRPDLRQMEVDPASKGQVLIYHTNDWKTQRRTENHWQGDLQPADAHKALQRLIENLQKEGWIFSDGKTKILMLTNNVLASEQGYLNLAAAFSDSDDYLLKKDPYIEFFADVLEPACSAFTQKKYGEMFRAVGDRTPRIDNHNEKANWERDMKLLAEARGKRSIGEVLKILTATKRPRLSSKLEEREGRFMAIAKIPPEERDEDDADFYDRTQQLRTVSYSEVSAAVR